MVDIKEVEQVFFMAMREGWVAGAKKIELPGMRGYKCIPFQYQEFHVLDRYCVNSETGKSVGDITIWHVNVPVWVMHYGGWYDKRAITFLKQVLCEAYTKNIFFGGRGLPFSYNAADSLFYTNELQRNTFSDFEGREKVLVVDTGERMGYHDYRGMSLE